MGKLEHKLTNMQLVGLLGGTFNPIHHGHLRLAQELADGLQLSEVRFIPSANPPHKTKPTVSAQQRAEMVKLAIEDNALFKLDTRELERSGASYTIDTLSALYKELNDTALCLMMGSDAFLKFDTWHRWQELTDYCHIVLVQRPNHQQVGLNQNLQNLMQDHYTENITELSKTRAGLITMQQIPALDISSSQIREMVSQHRNPMYLCPKSVIDYIQHNGLYL
jgi:nicotinate-nucleotide adenylyltransferase